MKGMPLMLAASEALRVPHGWHVGCGVIIAVSWQEGGEVSLSVVDSGTQIDNGLPPKLCFKRGGLLCSTDSPASGIQVKDFEGVHLHDGAPVVIGHFDQLVHCRQQPAWIQHWQFRTCVLRQVGDHLYLKRWHSMHGQPLSN